jgi:pimeloyl-ACP methyl ester carboxylesterase
MLREGSGEPLFLFHGILCTSGVWRDVAPALADDYDVIVPTALGHRGGPRPATRPASIEDVIDDAERQMDELGIEKAHLAGNSMGGWVSLELARRGRALSVCAISPAGLWEEDWVEQDRVFKLLLTAARDARRGRALVGAVSRSRRLRTWVLRDAAVHARAVDRDYFRDISADTAGCYVAEELIEPGHRLQGFDAPCPITLAWAEGDRLFPVAAYREHVEELIPGARFEVLEGVGHVPMYDDPGLVVETIRATVAQAAPAT